jgi:pseudaminic acid cytidylyltransferase
MPSAVAIIPARGGSKRIPRKNIKEFCGRPIIGYSIDAAVASGCFDEVMVSTDDEDISEFALANGAVVPFKRSEKNADDHSTLIDVMLEVISQYRDAGKSFDYYCCILPTAPTINAERLKEAYAQIQKHNADSVIAVVKFGYPIQRAFEITDTGNLRMMWPENLRKRSQDLPCAYMDAGQFYWGSTKALLEKKLILTDNTLPMAIPEFEAQDVDTLEDWKIAELKYRMLRGESP